VADLDADIRDEASLPLSDFQLSLERCVSKLNGRVKHSGRNAFSHLRLAWNIRQVDPAMAAFRAITAEEEAASALILSLKQKNYRNSSRLSHRDHVQKSALTPFFKAVAQVLATAQFMEPKLILDEVSPSVHVQINMKSAGLDVPEPLYGQPDQPLNFSIRHGSTAGEAHAFIKELDEIARRAGVREITAFVKAEANVRNRILYASDAGIPTVVVGDGFYRERLRRVCLLLLLTIAVQQTNMQQLFAAQCLRAFLLALEKIDPSEIEFPGTETSNGPFISVIHDGEGDPQARIGWKWNFDVPLVYSIVM
jgi:hypothetical protein